MSVPGSYVNLGREIISKFQEKDPVVAFFVLCFIGIVVGIFMIVFDIKEK